MICSLPTSGFRRFHPSQNYLTPYLNWYIFYLMNGLEKSNKVNFVFVVGRPGSGKDAQIDTYLRQFPEFIKISPGDIFRRGQNPNDPEYGKFFNLVNPHKDALSKGESMPGEAISAAVQEAIFSSLKEGRRSFIFNGHPRTSSHLDGADKLIGDLENKGYNVKSLFIYLGVPEKEAEQRMSSRFGGESKEGGFPRLDDRPEAARKRLEVFEEKTRPMLKELLRRSKEPDSKITLSIIRGNRDISEVQQFISREIGSFIKEKEYGLCSQ